MVAGAAQLLAQQGLQATSFSDITHPADVEAGYVVRMPKAYPYYDADYKANVDIIRHWLDSAAANVYPVGRNGMHKYNNQDHSMYTAMLAVENLLGAHHDAAIADCSEAIKRMPDMV